MKTIIALIFITLTGAFGYSNTVRNCDQFENITNYGNIPDGWYSATVKYSNYNTYTNSTYTLDVKVQYGQVTMIDFGNGGSIHTGINNEGYVYTGGYLNFEKDYYGNIVAAITTVSIQDRNGVRSFQIRIE